MTEFVFTATSRGFARAEFVDRYGVKCSLQASSLATEAAVWLGANEIGLKRFTPGKGWEDVDLPDGVPPDGVSYIANTRMHLTQDMVRALLPALTRFAETGELE